MGYKTDSVQSSLSSFYLEFSFNSIHYRDYLRVGAEGALAQPEIWGSEKRTERETDSLLLIAPRDQNPNVVPVITFVYFLIS